MAVLFYYLQIKERPMSHTEMLLDNKQQLNQVNEMPRAFVVAGAILLILNAVYVGILGFGVIGEVFSISLSVGLIMMLTAVGFIPLLPLWLGVASLSWFETIPVNLSKFEYRTRVIMYFIGGVTAPYLLYVFSTFTTLILAAFVSSLVG